MKRIFFTILLVMFMISINVYAEENTIDYGYIDIRAEIPEEFESNIMINFTLEDGTNALYTLTKLNGYKVQEKIPVGVHTLDFANIYDDLKGEFKVEGENSIKVEKNKGTLFKISVKSLKYETQIKSSISKEDDEFLKGEDVNKVKEYRVETNKGLERESFFKRNFITIIIVLTLLFISGIIKLKQIFYNN